MQLSPILRSAEGGRVYFWCPGCSQAHWIAIGEGAGPRWGYNGNADAPTFTPSILVGWTEPSDVPGEFDDTSKDIRKTCHSFVTDGKIQFLSDCTHGLAGQTVPLSSFPEGKV